MQSPGNKVLAAPPHAKEKKKRPQRQGKQSSLVEDSKAPYKADKR